jgi:putative transposase
MLKQRRLSYPSDLSQNQWRYIQDLIPKAKPGGRPRAHEDQDIVCAILYLTRSGIAWRYLPKDFPPWPTVYRYFSSFTKLGIWQRVLDRLHAKERIAHHLPPRSPSLLIIDSQSVKAQYGESLGYDGFKKVRGRKRHLLVDSLGFPFAIQLTKANDPDAAAGIDLLAKARQSMSFERVENFLADGSYKNRVFFEYVMGEYGLTPNLKTAKVTRTHGKPDGRTLIESSLKPKRWIVERSFAWLINYRRLNRDYERKIIYSEAMIQIAITILLLHRLVPP